MTQQWEALIVGIDEYPDYTTLHNLTVARKDGEDVTQKLTDYGYESFRIQRLPEQPHQKGEVPNILGLGVKLDELKDKITNIFNPPSVSETPDLALFFFSGHGWTQKVDGKNDVFFATSDVFPKQEIYGISLSWLGEQIEKSPVKKVVIWLDCCYSGELINYLPTNKDYCFITATRSFETGLEINDQHYQQGLFTKILLEGLNPDNYPDGIVDSHKLTGFIEKQMETTSQRPLIANSERSILLTTKYKTQNFIDECPYRSLFCFTETQKDGRVFYGRSALIQQLIDRVKKDRFIAVLGASGSGKSSLLRAGLLYRLKLGQVIPGSNLWTYLTPFSPTDKPLKQLEDSSRGIIYYPPTELKNDPSLTPPSKGGGHEEEHEEKIALLIKGGWGDQKPIIMIIDQFEECFTMCDETTRNTFFERLIELLDNDANLHIVIGMRSDFRGRLREYENLVNKINKPYINVEHLNCEEIEEAIMKPAETVGLLIEPALKEQLINDVKDYPGSLPLLQDTLTQLWKKTRHQGEKFLTLKTYKDLGGIEGTLDKRANTVFDSLEEKEKEIAKRIFLELIQVGDTFDTRRRVTLGDLVNSHHSLEILEQVTQTLANQDNRLITCTGAQKANVPIKFALCLLKINCLVGMLFLQGFHTDESEILIDVVHEALIRHWKRLGDWKQKYQNGMVIERRIEELAQEWDKRGRKKQELYPPSKLGIVEGYLKEFGQWGMLDGMAEEFITESRKHKQVVRRNWWIGGTTIGLLLIGLAIFSLISEQQALSSKKQADANAQKADANAQKAKNSEQQALSSKKQADANARKAKNSEQQALNSKKQADANARKAKNSEQQAEDNLILAKTNEITAKKNAEEARKKTVEAQRQTLIATANLKKTVSTLINNSQELFDSNTGKEFDALLTSLNAAKQFKKLAFGINPDAKMQVKEALQDAVFWVNDRNRLEGHKGAVNSVSFSPDGRLLASDSADGTIKIWDVTTGKVINTLDKNKMKINSFSFIKHGLLAYDSKNGTIKLWNVTTGKVIKTLNKNEIGVKSVTFSSNGRIASRVTDDTLKIWNVTTGKVINTLQASNVGVNSVIFSPDGQRLASQSKSENPIIWTIWNVTTGKPISTCQLYANGGFVDSVSFSPDGQLLASAGEDKIIHLCDIATGKEIKALMGHTWRIGSVSFSRNGKILASGGWDETIKLWDVATGQEIKTFTGHKAKIKSVSFGPKNLLASASEDGTIKLWDMSPQKEVIFLNDHNDHPEDPTKIEGYNISLSQDGKLLASTVNHPQEIKLWDVATHKEIATLTGHERWIKSVSFSPNGQWLASAAWDGTIRLWDIRACIKTTICEASKTLRFKDGQVFFSSISFSPDGKWLASAGNRDFKHQPNDIQIWDVATRPIKQKPIHILKGHQDFINSVSFSPNGQRLASGSADKTIKIWDVAKRIVIKTLTGHSDDVQGVSFSRDGKLLASGSNDHTIKLWDVATGKNIKTLTGHTNKVMRVSFSADGKWLVSGSEDKTIKVWDVATGKETHTFKGHRNAIKDFSLSNDGQLLASASASESGTNSNGELILWNLKILSNLTLDDLIAKGCNWVRGYLENNPNVIESDRHLCDVKPKKPNAKNG